MDRFRKILVGVQLVAKGEKVSLASQKAVEQAIWVARHWQGEVTLLHSIWKADSEDHGLSRIEVMDERVPEAGRRALQDLIERCTTAGVGCQLKLVSERAWLSIIQSALRHDADLVIVGKRERDKGERRLGSTAFKLLRKCPCPVWAVRPEHDLAHKLVLAATDLSSVGDWAVRWAAQLASVGEGEMHVVHAYRIPTELSAAASDLSEEEYATRIDAIRSNAQQLIQAPLEGLEMSSEPVLHIGRNKGSVAIREAVEHLQPDLLVMGTITRGGIPGFLVGTTAEQLLGQLDCSVLGVKPADFISPVAIEQLSD